jgi:hypothetical protein
MWEESAMKHQSQNVGSDPTIMGNERPRRDRDDDNLPKETRVQHEDPRNGMNRPVGDASRPDRSEDDSNEE